MKILALAIISTGLISFSNCFCNAMAEVANATISVKTIIDTSKFRFNEVARDSTANATWIAGRIDRSTADGKGSIVGATDFQPGHSYPGAHFVLQRKGNVVVTTVLRGSLKAKSLSYSWSESGGRKISRSDGPPMRPIELAQTILCRFNEKVDGEGRFEPIYMIPPHWLVDVEPAWQFFLGRFKTAKRTEMLASNNPFISLMAFDTLSHDWSGPDRETLSRLLQQKAGFLQAVMIYQIIKATPEAGREELRKALVELVRKSAGDPQGIEGPVLAASASGYLIWGGRHQTAKAVLKEADNSFSASVEGEVAQRVADALQSYHRGLANEKDAPRAQKEDKDTEPGPK